VVMGGGYVCQLCLHLSQFDFVDIDKYVDESR